MILTFGTHSFSVIPTNATRMRAPRAASSRPTRKNRWESSVWFVPPFKGNNLFFLSGSKDRQPNLENYYLSIDRFTFQPEGRNDQLADHSMEGECHFRMNKSATRFFEIKCDVYNRMKGTIDNFYLGNIQKIDRKTF
jgi:hypothetical protein